MKLDQITETALQDDAIYNSINKLCVSTDCVILGSGIFGLYAAYILVKKGYKVTVLEKGQVPYARASAINQARLHNGYHYPRSLETAKKASQYYRRFASEFDFSICNGFKQIYAIDKNSKISVQEYIDFCRAVQIPLKYIDSNQYFKAGTIEAAFITDEYSFDFAKIRDFLLDKLSSNCKFVYGVNLSEVNQTYGNYVINTNKSSYKAPLVINTTYAGVNGVIKLFGFKPFDLKYELCEVAFCQVPSRVKDVGITVMDGDYFSFMPFGSNDIHSVTSVQHTPQVEWQEQDFLNITEQAGKHFDICVMHRSKNCLVCFLKPETRWQDITKLMDRYITIIDPSVSLKYLESRFELKVILNETELDDARPTLIKRYSSKPDFISVLSGKLSTIYDLESFL